jgi:DNA alkylation repair enzyme
LAASTQNRRAQVLDLWRDARFREERYAALYLAGDKRGKPFQTLSAMKTYDELIVTGAWRDYVDLQRQANSTLLGSGRSILRKAAIHSAGPLRVPGTYR